MNPFRPLINQNSFSQRHSHVDRASERGNFNIITLSLLALMLTGSLMADVNVLIIGCSRDSGERHHSGVWWNAQKPAYTPNSDAFSATEIGTQLKNILDQDNRGNINVTVLDRYASHPTVNGFTAYSYNLMNWFHYPYPAGSETARWANLRGEGGTQWDYIVLIGDPYTMEYTPGMYSLGVSKIAEEVAKGPAELILFMPWAKSATKVNHYKEVVYRTARTGGHKVAPGALAWQACGTPSTNGVHPNQAGAYIGAASIYSSIYNQSAAASGYTYDNTNANTTQTTYENNNAASHYTGLYSFQNPYLMIDDKRREIHMSETGTSTEQGFKGKIKSAMARSMVTAVDGPYNDRYDTDDPGSETLGWPTSNPMPIGFNYGRDGFYSEPAKRYMINPAYWQAGFGYYYTTNTWSQTAEDANDSHIGLMQQNDHDLANRMLNEAPTARNIPVRTLWAQIHQLYPALRPQRDGSGPHLSYELDEAVGTFIYTMYSGRCPLDPEPASPDTNWDCRRIGYETAWKLSRCSSRAPGFKVTPSATGKLSIAAGTTETMSVVFIFPPQDDVTVTVGCSSSTAAIVGPKTLTFTPTNYHVPQQVVVAAIPGTTASEDFNVTFSTSSNDEAYDSLSDSWSYTATRTPSSMSQTDNGTAAVTALQNTPTSINLNAAGSNAGNTILVGPFNGSVTWTGDSVLEYTPDNGYLGSDVIVYAATVGSTQTIGCIDITVEVPNGQVNAGVGDGSASEQGPDTGTYVISRVGDASGSLNVYFSMSGTATQGSDYSLSHSSPVTIPNGQSSVTITLTPVDDSVFGEHVEFAILTIQEDAAYPIGTASSTVNIADNDNNAPTVEAGPDQSVYLSNSVPWDPTDLSPNLWLDATDYDGDGSTYADNTTLSTDWQDKSGNGNHYSLVSGPTYQVAELGGKDTVEIQSGGFNGPGGAAMPTSGEWTVIFAAKKLASDSNGRVFQGSTGNYLLGYWDAYKHSLFLNNAPRGHNALAATTTGVTDFEVGCFVRSADGTVRFYVNGALIYTYTSTDAASGIIWDFLEGGYSNERAHCQIGEFITLHRTVTDTERQDLDGYLAWKWGLEGNLPVGHDHENGAPGGAGSTVTLNGSVTDPEDAPTYVWTDTGTGTGTGMVTFSNPNALNPTVSFSATGTYVLRLTADDGYGEVFDEITITVNPMPSVYATWAGGTFANDFNDIDPFTNDDGDSLGNMMEFAFGTDPTVSSGGPLAVNGSASGEPVAMEGVGDAMEFYFMRRKDFGTSGSVSYTVQFSTDLTDFSTSAATPQPVADYAADPTNYQVVKVPFPLGARFGRVQIDFEP